jgi:hypothetical protein
VTRSSNDDRSTRAGAGPSREAHESRDRRPCTGAGKDDHPTGVDQAAQNRENDPPA